MMTGRHFPPGPLIHGVGCPGIAADASAILSTRAIAQQCPNGRMHNCYHFHQNDEGVVEVVTYPEHRYVPRAGEPFPGAARAFCRVCGGIHDDDAQAAGSGSLVTPAQISRVILPGEVDGGQAGGLILPGNR